MKTITLKDGTQLEAVVCSKCNAKIYPPESLPLHEARHEIKDLLAANYLPRGQAARNLKRTKARGRCVTCGERSIAIKKAAQCHKCYSRARWDKHKSERAQIGRFVRRSALAAVPGAAV